MPGLFVALLSFPRTVLSLKQSTEPMQVHCSSWPPSWPTGGSSSCRFDLAVRKVLRSGGRGCRGDDGAVHYREMAHRRGDGARSRPPVGHGRGPGFEFRGGPPIVQTPQHRLKVITLTLLRNAAGLPLVLPFREGRKPWLKHSFHSA